jgi:uncharacterized protein YjbI with pentapeptide repeats
VRLGGIYALERIANESGNNRKAIAEILTAYVRHHAKWVGPSRSWWWRRTSTEQLPGLRARQPDVQAVMTVLGRRAAPPLPPGEPEPERLFLAHVDLREAGLVDAKLKGADLRDAHLEGAHLERADLRDAQLEGAHLERADLQDADLQGADLTCAQLQGANLDHSNLQRARLAGADLQEASLDGAQLTNARADLTTNWPEGFNRTRAGVLLIDGYATGADNPEN